MRIKISFCARKTENSFAIKSKDNNDRLKKFLEFYWNCLESRDIIWRLHNIVRHGIVNLPVDAVVFAACTVAADRAQMFAARQRMIRRIRRDRLALTTGRCTQEVAVTTSIEGSLHAKQRERSSINLRHYLTVTCTFRTI